MDVHLRHLRYFVAVADHLHFRRAAESLFVSQPTLSKQIRSLELQVRASLFHRDRVGVRLTPAGVALLPAARALVEQWDRAAHELRAVATRAGRLTVGMSTGLSRGLMPAIRARFTATGDAGDLQIRQVPWSDATGGLGADSGERTDVAFVWLPIPDPSRYRYLEVATEPRRVALPATHPLARQDSIDLGELLEEPFLALPASSGALRDDWLATDARGGRPVVVGGEIASTEEAVEALVAHQGVCLVAAGNAPLITRDGVTTRPITGVPEARLVLAWRAGDDRPTVQRFRAAVAQALSGHDAVAGPARRTQRT